MARPFLTVAEGLLEHAECVADRFEEHGFVVEVEPDEMGYPYTPVLRCKRSPTTVLVEVYRTIPFDRIEAWTLYARSCSRDTRIALALPRDARRSAEDEAKLRELGVGLYLSDGRSAEEAILSRDLAVNVELPPLKLLHPRLRKILGSVYEQFEHSHWREGFEDACQAVEVLARKYLKQAIAGGRIVLRTKKGVLTVKAIDKMTMGTLAEWFGKIPNQNYADAKIAEFLGLINKDRVAVAHHKARAKTERSLRKNVGQHMWRVVDVLKVLLGLK